MKRSFKSYFVICYLKLGFGFISFFASFYKGNSRMVAKKIKLGAMIISLTTLFACNSSKTKPPEIGPTCYDPVSKEYTDSIKKVRKEDSLRNAEINKKKNDSINGLKVTCYAKSEKK